MVDHPGKRGALLMKVTVEVEKFNGTTTYEFDPLSIEGPVDMKPIERAVLGTVLRGLAELIDPETQ